jgi:lysophospholipase L1-like esterase
MRSRALVPALHVLSVLAFGCAEAERSGSGEASAAPSAAEPPTRGDAVAADDSVAAPVAAAGSLGTSPSNGADRGEPLGIGNGGSGGGSVGTASADSMGAGGASNGAGEAMGDEPQTCNATGAAATAPPTIWVIGDSTASVYTSDLYPRTGWAQPLQDYFAPACAIIQDRAISGRSSKSFFEEGAWAPIRDALEPGDYVLIQFGHNDEKADDPARFTEPFTTYEGFLSTYIDDTRAHGATPVLLTPIQRNAWAGSALRDTHGDYPVAMRELAATRGVSLVDATLLTTAYFERIGQAATTELFMNLAVGQSPNYPEGNSDNTHLQEAGARAIATLVLADFARQGLPIGRLVATVPEAP